MIMNSGLTDANLKDGGKGKENNSVQESKV
jgi:hypothetical protein